jgi:hypothetical protein
MKMKNTFLILIAALLIYACGSNTKTSNVASMTDSLVITLTKAPASPQYPDAKLTKNSVVVTDQDSIFAVDYDFGVENYELGVQTADADTRRIANSNKGQHIHFIVNDGPYSAHYMPEVMNTLKAGNYVVLAFLSRSYHESVKSAGAFYVENLKVGDVETAEVDLTAPHLFYSRPKGTYVDIDTKKLLLDFYLVNTTISPEGNKVRATINGKEFMITEWAPYYIEGLPLGEVTVKLELIDAEGNLIAGPYNSVERKVILE